MLANSEGAGKTAWMCRFLRAFPLHLSDNNPLLMTVSGIKIKQNSIQALAGQIISKACSLSPETESKSLILASNFNVLKICTPFVETLKFATPFSKVCVRACNPFKTDYLTTRLGFIGIVSPVSDNFYVITL